MNSVEILEGAIETIKQGWVQSSLAIDSSGKEVDPTDSAAVRWCILGSLRKAAQIDGDTWNHAFSSDLFPEWNRARQVLYDVLGMSLAEWNDRPGRIREDVLVVLNEALDKEKLTQ